MKAILFLSLCILIPTTPLLLLVWIYKYITKRDHFALFLLLKIWGICIVLVTLAYFINPLFDPMEVNQNDNFGTYEVIDNLYNKEQSKWQHDNFEITINKDDYLRIYRLIPNRKILDSVRFEFTGSSNNRIKLFSNTNHHHIIADSPALYRKKFNYFYYVFKSKKFGNVFFTKK